MMKNKTVAVALSGGVDSLVSAFFLKQKYKNVFGIHFTTGFEKKETAIDRLESQLEMPVYQIDLSRLFEQHVVHYFTDTYLKGKTPNPCLVCNKKIKFGALLSEAKNMGADLLATGHYAEIVRQSHLNKQDDIYLQKGSDPKKDQSYFLSLLTREQLCKIVFPLSGMTKDTVKKTAVQNNLSPLFPSESQDICFIHGTDFGRFILNRLEIKPEKGPIIDLNGKVVGEHQGLHQYTIGQRRGLNCPAAEPYYVKQIDIQNNQLVVCFKKDLVQSEFYVTDINWNYPKVEEISDITTKIRYSHPGAKAGLFFKKDQIKVVFETAQNAVTPGQAAVFYKNDRVLGAGIIQ